VKKVDPSAPAKPTVMREAAPERVAAFQSGLSAESRCAAWLIAKGYRIIARRFRSSAGEIDIIARRRGVTAFIEVKARATLEDAAYAITAHQQRRIIAAAEAFLASHPQYGNDDLRFDAMLIAPGRLPRHLIAAFDATQW
jgi:putative endonuclease